MKNKKIIPYICSFVLLFIVWWIASVLINSDLILPSPQKVFDTGLHLLVTKAFWKSFGLTLCRIFLAFFISTVLGFAAGYVFSLCSFVKHFFEPYITILQVTPVVALILIVNFWFKSYTVPVVIAVLMTLPIMTNAVYNGFMCVDSKILQMTEVYKLSKVKIFFKVKLPSAKPSVFMGLNSIFGLTWKVVIAGEVLCLPKFSIGQLMQSGNIHLETTEVMALTILLILICFILQKIMQVLLSCRKHKNNL